MSKYRINVRFDTDDPKQAEAVKFLQSLEHSRNAFIVSAVLDAVSGKSAVNNISLENIRKVIQEELRTLGIIQSLSGTGHCFDNARMESFFCYLEEGEDLPNRGIQAHQSTGQDHCFPIRFHLLQPHQSLFSEPRWFASCKIP